MAAEIDEMNRRLKAKFPTASRFAELTGPKAEKFGHLSLHDLDLEFAKNCLKQLAEIPDETTNSVVRAALWKSAIVHFMKCFGKNDSRSSLQWNKVFSDEVLRFDFEFFRSLRHNNIVHDSSTFSDYRVVMGINPIGVINRIAGIHCLRVTSLVEKHEEFVASLSRLIDVALEYVGKNAADVLQSIVSDCEKMDSAAMSALKDVTVPQPKWNEVSKKRPSWGRF